MAPLSVTLDEHDPRAGVVSLVGEHDAYSAGRIENELAVLFESGLRVVVDLTEATFIDSQTLSVLLSARHRAEAKGLGFVLALPRDVHTQVHRILEMTGLESSFAIEPTLEAALRTARAGQTTGAHAKVA